MVILSWADNGIKIPDCSLIIAETYVSGGIDLRAGFQKPSHNVIVPHLRSYPQRRGTVRSRCVRLRPVLQEHLKDPHVTILGGDEEGGGTVLTKQTHLR